MSKIGKINISIPEKVKVALAGNNLNIEGPLGKKSINIDLDIFNLDIKNGKEISIKPKKIDEDTKKGAMDIIDENLKWIEENDDAETEEYKNRRKNAEEQLKPFIEKIYQTGPDAAGGMPGGMPDMPQSSDTGPSVEDVD